ncbi:DUF2934 domain-containing protein [Bosea sp. 2YAB26]|uniref:DUF2934 domain-containing protein n=1 Tax=Bosea sp. 2YAB26 TaxID=3237478 RepID=UPI003F8EF678
MASKNSAQREIRKIAYALWMEQGQPDGRDREHWEAAKVIWAFRNHEAGGTQVGDTALEIGSHAARPLPDRR